MAGPPKKLSETKGLHISVPQETYDLLTILATKGRLGSRETDVASFLVVRECDRLFDKDYHLKPAPKP